MRELSLFTGVGGGLLGTYLLGWQPIGYVEWNDYCQRVIRQRILDGILPNAPIFGDIRTFVSSGCAQLYRGVTDVITAGFPCQPFSVAGKQLGADDPRNMWPATIATIRSVRPRFCLLENVPGLVTSGYFGTILGDLAEAGYDAEWDIFSACEHGAPHTRERLFIVAYTELSGRQIVLRDYKNLRTQTHRRRKGKESNSLDAILNTIAQLEKGLGEPSVFGTADGISNRVDRLGACGNGQFPAVAATAWRVLSARIGT